VRLDYNGGNPKCRVQKMVGGKRTTLDNSDYNDAATVAIKVRVSDSEHKVWIAGQAQWTDLTQDNDITWGGVALSGWQAKFDNLKVGYDNNTDDDIEDDGDDVVIDEDFSATTVTLNADHSDQTADDWDKNGNLLRDADYKYTYDAWNNLVKVTAQNDTDVVIATYAAYADNRRSKKVVSNRGDLDGTTYFFYDGPQVIEERNGSQEVTQQYVWGEQYVDELLMIMGENGTYFAWQDANWNVIGLTNPAGKLVEEYSYTPYGRMEAKRHTVLGDADNDGDVDTADNTAFGEAHPSSKGDPEYDRDFDANYDGEIDDYDQAAFNAQYNAPGADKTVIVAARRFSPTNNPYLYTARRLDAETGVYYYRARNYHPILKTFIQRDPFGYVDSSSLYQYVSGRPVGFVDPFGVQVKRGTAVRIILEIESQHPGWSKLSPDKMKPVVKRLLKKMPKGPEKDTWESFRKVFFRNTSYGKVGWGGKVPKGIVPSVIFAAAGIFLSTASTLEAPEIEYWTWDDDHDGIINLFDLDSDWCDPFAALQDDDGDGLPNMLDPNEMGWTPEEERNEEPKQESVVAKANQLILQSHATDEPTRLIWILNEFRKIKGKLPRGYRWRPRTIRDWWKEKENQKEVDLDFGIMFQCRDGHPDPVWP